MSSHHFVKEQQEPAILLLDVQGFSYRQVGPLLEWVPTVLVSQDALDTVLSWGIKVDVILADPDYQKANLHLLQEQYPVRFLSVKENRFLDEGLHYLLASKHHAVNILGLSHQNSQLVEKFLPMMDLVLLEGPMRYFPVKSGKLKKWFKAGSIQLHAPENTLIEVKSPQETQLIHIRHATFVELEEGACTLSCPVPFWVGEILE